MSLNRSEYINKTVELKNQPEAPISGCTPINRNWVATPDAEAVVDAVGVKSSGYAVGVKSSW
jgi:hypothetical protein